MGAWGDVVAGFRKNHLVPVDQLRLGTLEQAIGVRSLPSSEVTDGALLGFNRADVRAVGVPGAS